MVDLNAVISDLKKRVERGRAEGRYPPGLEQQLDAEFAAILEVVHRGDNSLHEMDMRLRSVSDASVDLGHA